MPSLNLPEFVSRIRWGRSGSLARFYEIYDRDTGEVISGPTYLADARRGVLLQFVRNDQRKLQVEIRRGKLRIARKLVQRPFVIRLKPEYRRGTMTSL